MPDRIASPKIVREAVAGLIWLYLDLPDDASRLEVEWCAGQIIASMLNGGTEDSLEKTIRSLQAACFCEISSASAIRALARRCAATTRSSMSPKQGLAREQLAESYFAVCDSPGEARSAVA